MYKRRIAGALALVGALALTSAACGGDESSSTGSATSTKPAAAMTPATKGTVTVWTYDAKGTTYKLLVEAFEKKFPNVTVKVQYVPTDQIHNKLLAAASARTGPDVIQYNGAFTKKLAEAGALDDMTGYWDAYRERDQFPDVRLAKVGSRVYGVQAYLNLNALWYNQDILDELGQTPPKTLDEMTDVLAAVAASGKYKGLQIPGTPAVEGEWISKPFMASHGAVQFDQLGDSGVHDAFALVEEWIAKGYVDKATTNLNQTDGMPKFVAGKTAFFVGGNWLLKPALDQAHFKLGAIPMPAGPAGPGIVEAGGEMFSIGAFSKDPELAWGFLENTWLSEEGERTLLETTGSIPSRADAGVSASTSSSQLGAYVDAAKTAIQLSSDTESTLAMGNLWSSLFAGQVDADGAAERAGKIAASAGSDS